MKKRLRKFLLMGMTFTFFGMVVQVFFINMLWATETNAQRIRNIKDVMVQVDVQDKSLRETFRILELNSPFTFVYDKRDEFLSRRVTLLMQGNSMEEVLIALATQNQLKFKQVNNNITVSKQLKNADPVIEVEENSVDISGTVTDQNGQPIPGATVIVEGTNAGTVTDVDGKFTLSVDVDATIRISFIGYESQRVTIANQTQLSITLREDQSSLQEVVVIGYGTQKKSDITGAISSISSKDLAEIPAANVMEQAQGRLAGVDIVRSNGSPGAPMQIRIRGNRSITANNDPLFVIDGIPTSANINDFNPNDIESIEVLKDASAVAIYGSRGANGVILITTKKGKDGKAVISYDGYYGVKNPVENINLMNGEEYAQYIRIANGLDRNDNSRDAALMSQEEADNLVNGRETDWLDLVVGSGSQQEHQLSVSGGTKDVKYYLSGSYFDEKGLIPKTGYSRYSARANIEANLNSKLKMGLSSTLSTDIRNQMRDQPYNNALIFSPLSLPYDAEGNVPAFPNQRATNTANPILYLQPNQYENERKGYRIFANIYADYTIHKNLSYRVNFGPDIRLARTGIYTGTMDGSLNTASVNNFNEFSYTLENILNYNKQFGEHTVDVVGLFSTQESRTETSFARGMDIPIETSSFYDLGGASTLLDINSGLTEWGLMSYMGRVNYRFKERYLFTATGRSDGSSRLAEGRKWAFFPSLAVGWIISEENFFSSSPSTFLKLRAGYGEVGNTSIAPFQTLGGLARSVYAFGEEQAFGYRHSIIPNPDLGWEISKTINVGLDFGLFNDRVTGSLELYNTNTQDLLLSRLLPITSGYQSILQNIGATRNRGIEFSASSYVIDNKDGLRWDVSFNIFSNKEEIVELFDGQNDDVGNQWFIGQPINVFYSFKHDGIWQSDQVDEAKQYNQAPGDIRIADVNGRNENGELTNQPDGQLNADDRTVLGSTVPNWSGGITNRFTYKGIDFSFLVFARMGQMIRSDFHWLGANNWQGRTNMLRFNYWTPDNPSNEIPIPKGNTAPLYADAVRFYDGSFVKIRNISLGYTVNSPRLKDLGFSALRIYGTANNAFTFAKYDVVDPETSNGIVGGSSPLTTATYVMGISVKF
nr:SusC/RagA family TonB-linked outer membrane protein [Cytophagales bacterium]